MDVALENPDPTGTEGARRRKPLNLSGKRTEMETITGDALCPYPFVFSSEQHRGCSEFFIFGGNNNGQSGIRNLQCGV